MANKFKNKYRIPSARFKNWDYGNNGAYFITICTQNRKHFFGEIVNGKMVLNEFGQLAEKYWLEIPDHFSFVRLGEFVVMPNHTHGILIVNKTGIGVGRANNVGGAVETLQCNVSTANANIPTNAKNEQMAKISPKPGTISTIVRSYKSVVSKNGRLIHAGFAWQSRFHDHIIRNMIEYQRIEKYIVNNPSNWKEDGFKK